MSNINVLEETNAHSYLKGQKEAVCMLWATLREKLKHVVTAEKVYKEMEEDSKIRLFMAIHCGLEKMPRNSYILVKTMRCAEYDR